MQQIFPNPVRPNEYNNARPHNSMMTAQMDRIQSQRQLEYRPSYHDQRQVQGRQSYNPQQYQQLIQRAISPVKPTYDVRGENEMLNRPQILSPQLGKGQYSPLNPHKRNSTVSPFKIDPSRPRLSVYPVETKPANDERKRDSTYKEVVDPKKQLIQPAQTGQPNQPIQSTHQPQQTNKKLPISYIVKSVPGRAQGQLQPKTNQDAYFIAENFCNYQNASLFMVLDGHGSNGHIISYQGQMILYGLLEQYFSLIIKSEMSDPMVVSGFQQCIMETEKQLLLQGVDMSLSGSTVICILLVDRNLWCINIGDSRALLISNNFTTMYMLSEDHKPDNNGEKSRILKEGGRVSPVRDQYGQPMGPYRVWVKNYQYPGLAMSRSLGDTIAHSVGVVTTPDVITHKIANQDQYIVMGSDGLFELMDNNTISKIVKEHSDKSISYIADILIQKSIILWEKDHDSVDDITCLIIRLF